MKRTLLLTLCIASTALTACAGRRAAQLAGQPSQKLVQDLGGSTWQFRADAARTPQLLTKSETPRYFTEWAPATVPGVVHTDLFDNGMIEEPFGATAEPRLQWIEHETWVYRTTFAVFPDLLGQNVQELVFTGLDTYAEVRLNDSLVLKSDNMFIEWRVDVKGLLREGGNTLEITFLPAYETALPLAEAWPVKLPADNDKGEWKTSVFTRKAPYQFGWDWGPRYATVGVWRPVRLEGYNDVRIDNVQFLQRSQSGKLAEFDAHVTLAPAAKEGPVTVYITDSAAQKVYAKAETTLSKGQAATLTLPVEIKNPELWWPNGLGDPHLYTFRTIVADGEQKLDENTQRIGVRTIRLVQEPDTTAELRDKGGVSFYFEVNGQPCFAKGANYIPQDIFPSRVTPEQYTELINTTKASNMNMLRVWGGGIYEDDLFYDLCDANGIMVWQDFMFACSFYPSNPEFLGSVRTEAIQNVRRLRNHPSITIWCGNNEIDEAWYHWGYARVYKWTEAEKALVKHGIDTLFRGVLADVIKAEDTTRYYHPSSPLYGRGNKLSQVAGDVHYWGVFHDEEPFSVYKDKPGRFSNEYGFQSLACYDTYREYFGPEDMRLYSPAMVIHQKNPKGYRVIEEYMVRDLPLLKDDFRTYVYLSQLLQAEGIKIAMEGHRMRRPFTMGSLYWQLNDLWPVASWSSMDSRMRWKALQYYARRSFAPTGIYFEQAGADSVKLWAITDELTPQKGRSFVIKVLDFSGKQLCASVVDMPDKRGEDVTWLTPNSTNMLRAIGVEALMKVASVANGACPDEVGGAGDVTGAVSPRDVFLVAEGSLNGVPMRAVHYFVPLKDLRLPAPDFEVSYRLVDDLTVEATLKAKNLLKSVLFDAEALQWNPSDAYFDLLPGEERVITLNFVKPFTSVDELGISVRSLNTLVGRPGEKPVRENVK